MADPQPEPQRLFLSYSRGDDEPFVRRLDHDLSALGFTVWWDRECMPRRSLTFLPEIRDALEACDRLLAVIGPQASQSIRSSPSGTTPFCPIVLNQRLRVYEPSAPFSFCGQ